MELLKISILCGNGTSAGSLQVIQAFSNCDFAEPGFFVSTIKTGEILYAERKTSCVRSSASNGLPTDFRQMENIKFWYVCIRYSRYSSRVM